MRERLVEFARTVGRELEFYRLVAIDPRTPAVSRLTIGAALAYAASPVDLIPDWFPVIGHLDDLIVVPALIYLGIRRVPDEVIRDCRARVGTRERHRSAAEQGPSGVRRSD